MDPILCTESPPFIKKPDNFVREDDAHKRRKCQQKKQQPETSVEHLQRLFGLFVFKVAGDFWKDRDGGSDGKECKRKLEDTVGIIEITDRTCGKKGGEPSVKKSGDLSGRASQYRSEKLMLELSLLLFDLPSLFQKISKSPSQDSEQSVSFGHK